MLPGGLWLLEIQVTYESTRSVQLKGAGSNAVSSNRELCLWEYPFFKLPSWIIIRTKLTRLNLLPVIKMCFVNAVFYWGFQCYISGSSKTKTNFMDTYGQWPYFDGLQEWNLMFCIVSCPKPPCVFATVVSPIYNGRKLTCGLKIQRNDSFSPSKSFKPFAYRRANRILIQLICLHT